MACIPSRLESDVGAPEREMRINGRSRLSDPASPIWPQLQAVNWHLTMNPPIPGISTIHSSLRAHPTYT